MSALSTPGGGGTTTQTKPTSGKQKYQKLDINSLYCANRNENSEPSSVKSQLSRKHGMQSLGKVPSARRPPANLPSLKTETGQDPNTNSVTSIPTTVSTPATCTSQATTTTVASAVGAAAQCGMGWVTLPPPSSPHFRTEFPSLEAAAQPTHTHRATEHAVPHLQLRPQSEGSWTSGGSGGVRQESTSSPAAAPASTPASQQTPAFRAILPSFLMKGSNGAGLGLSAAREPRSGAPASNRALPRPPATPRAVELLTARPILRDEQISSLDDISRDAGWAQQDDIDYDQKLDFSDGESAPAPSNKTNKNNNSRASLENERMVDSKVQEPGDEDQLWAERRQKQSNEVAQAVARARQRKEEEQRRQMRDTVTPLQPPKDTRNDRDRNDNRDRDNMDAREDKSDSRDNRDRPENRDKERTDRDRDVREKDRGENRERFDNRDVRDRDRERDRVDRDRLESRDRPRNDNRDSDKERLDVRERDRNENRDRDRFDRDRGDRDRERDRIDRDNRDRDRDFRDRDRDYRDQFNPAFSKTFQANIPPRFMKQQQNRQQEDHNKGWAFTSKAAPRRQDQQPYIAPRHAPHNNGRRSYSRDYSDREEDFRRDKDGPGPQWRSEMQDYERTNRELDRSHSRDSYKEYDRRSESDRKSLDSVDIHNANRTSAAEKLTEVFERKSIGLVEPFANSEIPSQAQGQERRNSPPSSKRESSERDFGKTSWADVTPDEPTNYAVLKSPVDKSVSKDTETVKDNAQQQESGGVPQSQNLSMTLPQQNVNQPTNTSISISSHNQPPKYHTNTSSGQNVSIDQQMSQHNSFGNIQSQPISSSANILQPSFTDSQTKLTQSLSKPVLNETVTSSTQIQRTQSSEQTTQHVPPKPVFASQKSDKEHSETETVASTISGPLTDSLILVGNKTTEVVSVESGHNIGDSQKQRSIEDKRNDKFSNDQLNKLTVKEPIERKSSGSGSEKKSRGYGGCGYPVVYNRGWGSRESRGRRSHRSSRSNNRASESDGSTDGAPNSDRKERRRAPRSPRGPKKADQRPEEVSRSSLVDQPALVTDPTETRTEPFAPRGQPSRRGRGGGFTGTSRPPAPAKRVTGYGPPNTKSPFSQANRVKDNEDNKDVQSDDKGKANNNKTRTGSSSGRGRDRRPKTAGGPLSGEDENWETTSEHSEGGAAGGRRSVGGRPSGQSKGPMGRNHHSGNRQINGRNTQGAKKDNIGEFKTSDITEAMTDMKLSSNKKDEDIVDDGFQEVRNKKNSKDIRTPPCKEENQHSKQPRSHSNSNQGGGRNGSSSRNTSDKSRGPAPMSAKPNSQYDRSRQANLAPRFVKQRQKQQMGLVPGFGPDTGAAPPPPAVNAWDKPISQTLRGSVEEAPEDVENKSGQTSQHSTPADAAIENKTVSTTPCAAPTDKVGVLDGTTPPVETIIFENTNYKTAPPAEALKQKYQPSASTAKPQHQAQHQGEDITPEIDSRTLAFNGDVRAPPRTIQELIADNSRPVTDGDSSLGLPMSFDTAQKAEDSSDMKLDFAFDSDLGQLTEDKSAKLGLPRGPHMSTSNTISPLAADLNLKIASVKKVWEMPAVVEGGEELQFAGFTEENNPDTGAPPNVCKVKPTQQLQSPPPQHYNHVGYQGGYSGLSVPSPPALVFNSSQQLLGSSQQLQQQGGLYGAFLDQSRGQFGGFPGSPYGAGNATPYNYQPPPDMFQSLPSQYRMAAAGGGAAFGQSGQLGNSPSTVLISSTSNSLMSATVKPSTQQIGAIGSKGGGVNTYQQQYLGYSGPVGEAPYSLPGLMTRPAPPASSYYSPYQPPTAPAPTYPLQFTQPTQSGAYSSQFLSSQLQVAAAVQQMQQQYRAPLQPQYAAPPQPAPRPPPQQQLKSPLHEHANGFAPLCEAPSPTPKGVSKPQKPPHSPPHHKYHVPPPHAHPPHQQPHQQHHHQQHQQALGGGGGNNGRGGSMPRGGMAAPRYPAPIQRPLAPPYRGPPAPPRHHAPRHTHNLYYQQRKCASGGERADGSAQGAAADEPAEPTPVDAAQPAEVKAD